MEGTVNERVREIMEMNKFSMSAFAREIGVAQPTVSKIVNGKSEPQYSTLVAIVERFGIDAEWLLMGSNDMFVYGENEPTKDNAYLEDPNTNYREIPVIDGEVFGTISPAMSDALALKPEAFARIPQFSKGDYAVQVTGNSMKGVINHGDWIVIKRILNKEFIIYGECYLVVTKSDNLRTVKYLNENQDDEETLWLSPYNKEQFNSQLIPKEEILELYSVIGVFRKM